MIGVILAGGSGARFWPKSRESFPKQLLNITGTGTLVQNTFSRLLPSVAQEDIYLVTGERHAVETCQQLEPLGFSPQRLIAEPVGRNTAAAIAWAAATLQPQRGDEVMAVFPADHEVVDTEKFDRALKLALQAAEAGYLVTLGIHSSRPETGFGYIKKGAPLADADGAFKVDAFIEKPDAENAQQMTESGGYFWNCGIFIWKISTLLEELKIHMPDLHMQAIAANTVGNAGRFAYQVLNPEGKKLFTQLPSISIDYGLMEKSQRAAVIPVEFGWSDVGSWNALEDIREKDDAGNVKSGDVLTLDSEGCILQGQDRLVAALGVKDLMVIDTPDALLVADKNRAQEVKKVFEQLKAQGRKEALVPNTVQKPWGSYTNLETGTGYLVKKIEVRAGQALSLQSHRHRSEHWTVVQGRAEVELDDKTVLLDRDQSIYIPKGSRHRLSNPGEALLILVESQIGDTIDEEDIIRHEDKYGRS